MESYIYMNQAADIYTLKKLNLKRSVAIIK